MNNKELAKHIRDRIKDINHEITISELIKAYTKGFDAGVETVKNERPQGEWKAKTFHHCYCNKCNFTFDLIRCEFMGDMNYCSKCGAEMKGGTE